MQLEHLGATGVPRRDRSPLALVRRVRDEGGFVERVETWVSKVVTFAFDFRHIYPRVYFSFCVHVHLLVEYHLA